MLRGIKNHFEFFRGNGIYSQKNLEKLRDAGILDQQGNIPYFSPGKMMSLLVQTGVPIEEIDTAGKIIDTTPHED